VACFKLLILETKHQDKMPARSRLELCKSTELKMFIWSKSMQLFQWIFFVLTGLMTVLVVDLLFVIR